MEKTPSIHDDHGHSIKLLLARIDKFLETSRMQPWEFGKRAAQDSSLVKRLREGGDVTTRKFHKIMSYLDCFTV